MKRLAIYASLALGLLAACGGDDTSSTTGDVQTPPMGHDAIESWLATGAYKTWSCETAVHASRDPSPHSFNRICSNDKIAGNATATADWPMGAAAVKELYASVDGTDPVGYAVYLKTASDTAAGANWYWYERVPLDSDAPHDGNGVVADGLGSTGTPKSICVGCHMGAGIDAMHTPSPGGRDEVYTPVH